MHDTEIILTPEVKTVLQHRLDSAAVAAGIYKTTQEAQKAMGQGFEKEYVPNAENVTIYAELYRKYLELGKINL